MISVKLMGGLGNQLFQIASTYAYAKDNNFEVGFDLSETLLPLQGRPASTYERNLYMTLPKIKHEDYSFHTYTEPRWEYDKIPPKDNLLLKGYFQSPKYFDHRRKDVLSYFLNEEVRIGILNRLKDAYCVELKDSVSVHIRRGDYLKFPNIHPMPPMSYFIESVRQISEKTPVNCVLVFSDDIDWCKRNIHSPKFRFVEGLQDYEELLLMSLCSANVICNSSFSWWGAYLNEKVNKIVYAPKKWFGSECKHDWQSIYTKEMITL